MCALNNKSPELFDHYWEGQECSKSWEIYFCRNARGVCDTHWHSCSGDAHLLVRTKHMWEYHFPHGPYPLALQLAKRRGMPRKRRERYDMDSPASLDTMRSQYLRRPGTCTDRRSSNTLEQRPTFRSAISRTAKSRRSRAHTVSMRLRSPLLGGNLTEAMPQSPPTPSSLLPHPPKP